MLRSSRLLLQMMFILLGLISCSQKKAPLPEKAASSPSLPERKPLIVIDPGHGGEDFGTYSRTKPRLHEKHFTLETAKLVDRKLRRLGYRTLLTRQGDQFISLQARVLLAEKRKASLFVSIHYNSAPSDQAQGIEVFYCKDNAAKKNRQSKLLADSILSRLIDQTKAKSRGVKFGNFLVIREAKMPSVLVEAGFLSNSDELKEIKTLAYQEKIADGIVQGIIKYLRERRRLSP
ncbi:MAG: amiA [Chlamydiales bacterium]|jgi:N-acetylmuramoyl-L-alanine amidase|nr:amiA [Chlamydiales bacterium]